MRGWDLRSEEGKSEERLVDPADHDAGVFVPVLDVADVLEGRAHVPGEQAPAHNPEDGEKAVDRDIEVGSEAYAAVQHDCDTQGCNGEQGGCHELRKAVSMSYILYDFRTLYDIPARRSMVWPSGRG